MYVPNKGAIEMKMANPTSAALVLAVMPALFHSGCSREANDADVPPVVSLEVSLVDDLCGVTSAEAEIQATDEPPLGPFPLDVQGDVVTGSIGRVPAGPRRRVTVLARNVQGQPVYQGSALIDVLPDSRSEVSLVLARNWETCPGAVLDADGGTGSAEPALGELGIAGSLSNAGPTLPLEAATLLLDEQQSSTWLIDAFVHPDGIVVVSSDAVRLIGRDGAVRDTWSAPRQITAAAMEGDVLGVADAAMLTGLEVSSAGLFQLSTASLIESCADAVVVSGDRFVCGPGNDWDRIFYVFNLRSGAFVSSSSRFTYNGTPMRRVPGTDAFVTVTTNLSPSDYHIYVVDGGSSIAYIGETPYHGDFPIGSLYAFDGAPPAHLITHEGRLLNLASAACGLGGSGPGGCLVQDGVLGTLSGAQYYVAMHNAGSTLYAVTSTGGASGNVLLQSIDVARRVVLTERIYALDSSMVQAMSWDRHAGRVLLALRTASGYRIELQPLGPVSGG